jgi:4-alpha-glucanotransferase
MTAADAEKKIVTDAWGIDDGYRDVSGAHHPISDGTRAALLKAMGVGGADHEGRGAGAYGDVVLARGARAWLPDRPGQLRLEDGSSREVAAAERIELPLGYHEFRPHAAGAAGDHRPIRLIATPATCHLPAGLRAWGWAAQLYAARSRRSWGIGDLGDLASLAAWSRDLGAGVLMVNPLIAPTPVLPIEPSPYFPSSRRFRNPIYLRIEDVPGAPELGDRLAPLASSGHGLNQRRRIDRDAVFALKMHALELCFARFGGAADFDAYRAREGRSLTEFATFCALAERHGRDWRRWPSELRRPDGAAVASMSGAGRPDSRVTFHAWLQWLLDQQLGAASRHVGLIQDLPIGIDAAGADAWCWQDLLAQDVSVGVPPDEFNPAGQDWGLTPFVPHKLRAAGYQPLIETIRATARHAGGLRIDHVMGLFRLFWIPRGADGAAGGADHGAFVRTRADELFGIIALESQRAGAFVVGEDLGTVEPGVRETMADHGMLSYRLMYFEDGAPSAYPELALTAVTTHDLPTLAGLWTGADLARAELAQVPQNQRSLGAVRDKIARLAGAPSPEAPPAEVVERVHAALAAAPSRVLLATLDDALAVEERPNLPGADRDWPNWSISLPVPLEELATRELPRQIARALSRGESG